MLDRMSLSMKNGWKDKEDRTYIVYTVEQIAEDIACGRDKAIKVSAELDRFTDRSSVFSEVDYSDFKESGKGNICIQSCRKVKFEIENKKYEFPFEAVIRCEILDDMGNCIVIDTEYPDYIESQEELHVFKVNKKMIKAMECDYG